MECGSWKVYNKNKNKNEKEKEKKGEGEEDEENLDKIQFVCRENLALSG